MNNTDSIRDKVLALLRTAQPGSGATESEAANALALAAKLMAKYNIEVGLDDDEAQAERGGFKHYGMRKVRVWHIYCAEAASYLYNCMMVIGVDSYNRRNGCFEFAGRPDSIAAAEMTFHWLIGQVEQFYKDAINDRRGMMSKAERAEFRRTFKDGCALRIKHRAWEIVCTLANDDLAALEATGSTALTVRSQREQQMADAQALLEDCTAVAVRSPHAGLGTIAGIQAGDRAKLNETVEQEKFALEHKKPID